MAAKLVAEEGILKDLVLSLKEGDEWTIGRDPDVCTLVIEDPSASRRHLRCYTSSEGIMAENLSVTAPILLNDEPMQEPHLLSQGDTLKIGNGLYRFYSEEEAEVITDEQEEEEEEEHLLAEDEIEEVLSEVETQAEEEEEHEEIFSEEKKDKALAEIDFTLTDTSRWLLKVIGGPNTGAEFSMLPDHSYLIGTDPNSCDIVFHDTSVSRQHARITLSLDDKITLQDLNSRNGTFIDGEKIEGKQEMPPNTLVTMGTTSFLVYDREGKMHTIISPLLPSIVKVLQRDDEEDSKEEAKKKEGEEEDALSKGRGEEKKEIETGKFVMIALMIALFLVVSYGTYTLFRGAPVKVEKEVNIAQELKTYLQNYPSVEYNYIPSSGRLLLVGHVLTAGDKSRLLYNLHGLKFIKNFDASGIVIDEYVWRETNQVINRNPQWRGINLHSPAPGSFVLSGYLKTRKESEDLMDYMSANFAYLDLLEKRIIVEEEVVRSVDTQLENNGIRNVSVEMEGGDLYLRGGVGSDKQEAFKGLLKGFAKISGVRNVKSFVTQIAPEESMINITSKYNVSGFSNQGGQNLTVVINGRILTKGDTLDGMLITNITTEAIFLEKDGLKYRINYNQ